MGVVRIRIWSGPEAKSPINYMVVMFQLMPKKWVKPHLKVVFLGNY